MIFSDGKTKFPDSEVSMTLVKKILENCSTLTPGNDYLPKREIGEEFSASEVDHAVKFARSIQMGNSNWSYSTGATGDVKRINVFRRDSVGIRTNDR